jgi:hypothetical protein
LKGDDLPYISLFTTGEEGFPCGRFPMMLEAWGMVLAVAEWTTIYGDHCGKGSDNAHATGRLALKNSTDGGSGPPHSNLSRTLALAKPPVPDCSQVMAGLRSRSFGAPFFLPLSPLAYARDPSILYIKKIDRLCVFFDAELKVKISGLAQNLGQFLTDSNQDVQLNHWASLRILRQHCGFQVPGGHGPAEAGGACGNDGGCSIHRQCKTGIHGAWEAPVALAPHLDAECAGYIQGRPVGVVLSSGRLLLSTWRATFGGPSRAASACARDLGTRKLIF